MSIKILKYQRHFYLREARKSTKWLIGAITIFGIAYLFQEPIIRFLRKSIIDTFLSHILSDGFAEALLILFISCASIFFIFQIFKKRIPSPGSIITSILMLLIYFIIIRQSDSLEFFRFRFWNNLLYADVTALSISIFLLRFKNYSLITNDNTDGQLLEDSLYTSKNDDFLARKPFAKEIAHHLSQTVNEKAFAISIIGDWGSGKSVFLKFLEEELNTQANNEIIRFNPWKSTDSNSMIFDFFTALSNSLKKFDQKASDDVRTYGKYLSGLDEGLYSKLLGKFISQSETNSISDRYEEIETAISLTGKRFIVFIDDSDRLTGMELIHVLKLIRNTANFRNLVFIAALDTNYAISAIKKTKMLSSETGYMEKIFQLEIVLPPISKGVLYQKFRDLLEIEKMPEDEKQDFENALRHLSTNNPAEYFFFGKTISSSLFEQVFNNLRDIVRFVNSFRIRYRVLKGEVDLFDLIVLEMLKLKSVSIYNLIIDKKLLAFMKDTSPDQYCLDNDEFEKLYNNQMEDFNLAKDSKDLIKSLLTNLFSFNENYKTHRSIIFPVSFSMYVNYQLLDVVSLKEYKIYSEKPDDEFYNWVKKEYATGKKESVDSILGSMYQFESGEQFKKYILLFLRLALENSIYTTHALGILKESETVKDKYFGGNSENAALYLKQLFSDVRIDPQIKIEFGSIFTREAFEYKNTYYFDQSGWQEIVLNAFKIFKSNHVKITFQDLSLYVKNWSGLGPDRKIMINPQANKFFYECIQKDPIGFIKHAIRPYYTPPNEVFTFEPFIKEIFGSQESFEDLLNSLSTDDELAKLVKRYYQVYKKNSYREFVIEDKKHSKFILDQIKKLDQEVTN